MVDPFLDPLDTMPVKRPVHPLILNSNNEKGVQSKHDNFETVLSKKIEQKPTPVITPEHLQVNHAPTVNDASRTDSGAVTDDISAKERPIHATSVSTNESLSNLSDLLNQPRPLISSQPPQLKQAIRATNQIVEKESVVTPFDNSESDSVKEENPTVRSTQSSDPRYTIQRGDTLSEIVSSRLKAMDISFTTKDLYRMVQAVARHNGIANPDIIFAGQSIDLSPLVSQSSLALQSPDTNVEEGDNPTAWADQLKSISNGYQVPVHGSITSRFGMRIHPIHNREMFHHGIDIGAPVGTPIRPLMGGRVLFSGELPGYGETIKIKHEDGTEGVYAHLSERMVEAGVAISTNDTIGLSGNTGVSTGPHLHFEIRRNGEAIDPLTLLAAGDIESIPTTIQLAQGNRSKPASSL